MKSSINFSLASLLALTSIACTTTTSTVETSAEAPAAASSTAGHGFRQNLPLDSFGIVGISTGVGGTLWLSDADNNRLIHLRSDGTLLDSVTGFDRPMHIASRGAEVLVAEYGADRIASVQAGRSTALPFVKSFDAPSGIDVRGDRRVVADFYNHRVVFQVGEEDRSFGTKGTGPGELTYPTDVQIAHDKIWVADAYNHRVQVFGFDGSHLLTFGEAEAMNAATGLFVSADAVYVTDFENSRVQIYGLDGTHRGTLSETLDKPTDVLVVGDILYVVNYAGRSLSIFTKS